MSKEKSVSVDIYSRIAELVTEFTEGENEGKFADIAGINRKTFYTYKAGRSPSVEALASICRQFKVSLNWLVLGIGPKYLQKETPSQANDLDPEVAELVRGAERVLTSGNKVATRALEHNIRYFEHAIEAEKRADQTEKMIEEMKNDMAIMMQEIERLKIENQRLDSEEEGPSSNEKVA